MINDDDVTKKTIEHNLTWPQIYDHPCRILTIEGFGCGKTSALPNLMKQQDGYDYSIIDKVYLYVKDSNKAKYLIKKCGKMVLKI